MTTATIDHIEINERGQAKIKGYRVKVIHLVEAKNAGNLTTEELCEEYPHLPIAAIHASLAYYYDHKDEIDREIEEGIKEYWEEWRENQKLPHVQALKAIKDQDS